MIQKSKAVTSIRIDADLFNEVKRQKINLSQLTEDAMKVAIGKPTLEFLYKQRQHIEEELAEINKKIEELEREKKTQEEIAERKMKEEQEIKKLDEESKKVMLEVWKELIGITTKSELTKIMDKFIKNNQNNPFTFMKLRENKKIYEGVVETVRWGNWVRQFKRELGMEVEDN
jgi:post-segregation antitoxin (ccd killing protein)